MRELPVPVRLASRVPERKKRLLPLRFNVPLVIVPTPAPAELTWPAMTVLPPRFSVPPVLTARGVPSAANLLLPESRSVPPFTVVPPV
jgi:hypothetical protein